MEGSLVVESGVVKVVARIVDPIRDRKIWVGEYQSAPDAITTLQRRIASEAGAAMLKRAPQ